MAGKVGQATVQARHAVETALADLDPGSLVLVACSGGPDSSALAAATAFVAPRQGIIAQALVVDHGLQPDSAAVAQRARQTCERLGLAASVARVTVGRHGGPEAAAREARYAALRERAAELGASAVLLGHTLDDQAETVLLRLARGSGARSLSAMRERDGLWRRPFLVVPRAVVAQCASEALAEVGQQPWQDPQNIDPRFTRSRVRSALATLEQVLGAGLVPGLARTAQQLRDDADALDEMAEQAYRGIVRDEPDGHSGEAAALSSLPRAVRTRIIRAMCLAAGCDRGALTADQVWAVERLVTAWHGQGPTRLPGGVWADRRYGRLGIHRPADPE